MLKEELLKEEPGGEVKDEEDWEGAQSVADEETDDEPPKSDPHGDSLDKSTDQEFYERSQVVDSQDVSGSQSAVCAAHMFGDSMYSGRNPTGMTSVSRDSVRRGRYRMGNGTVHAAKVAQKKLFTKIGDAAVDRKLNVVAEQGNGRMDETPQALRMLDPEHGVRSGIAKLMQVQYRWGYLLELLPRPGVHEGSAFVTIRGEIPTWLTAMDGKSAEVIFASVRRACQNVWNGMEHLRDRVKAAGLTAVQAFRTATSDQDGANLKWAAVEDSISGIPTFLRACSLHPTATTTKETVVNMVPGIPGRCANNSNTLQLLGNVRGLRKASCRLAA